MLSTILLYVPPVLSCIALVASVYAVSITKKKSVRAISLRKMEALLDRVEDIEAMVASLAKRHRNLNQKIVMRDRRAAAKTNGTGEPDSKTDPEAWKAWAREHHRSKLGAK